jgi:hypothetical protein
VNVAFKARPLQADYKGTAEKNDNMKNEASCDFACGISEHKSKGKGRFYYVF